MRKRGYTLTEMLVGMIFTCMLILFGLFLFSTSLNSMRRTDVKIDLQDQNSMIVRKIGEELRSAVNVQITSDGKQITYELPKKNTFTDPVTGEHEYVDPIVGDGIERAYFFENGKLYYQSEPGKARLVVSGVLEKDPEKSSSYYNMSYPIFSYTNIGSTNGLKIMLILEGNAPVKKEHSRMSTTVMLRNVK